MPPTEVDTAARLAEQAAKAAEPPPEPNVYLGSFPIAEPDKLPADSPMRNLYSAWQAAGVALDTFRAEARKIDADQSLSPVGKVAAKLNVASEVEKGLGKFAELLTVAENKASEDRGALLRNAIKKASTDPARASELSAWFRDRVAAGDRLTVIGRMIADGDVESLAAIVNAPRAYDLLPDKLRERAEGALLELVDPEGRANAETMGNAIDVIKFAHEAALRHIRNGTGARETDADIRARIRRISE